MAVDSNGQEYEDRTLQFHGIAYGNSNVTLTATINGDIVFSGEVLTIDAPVSFDKPENIVLLFSVENTTLFPSNRDVSYPMSLTVTGGDVVVLTDLKSNYMNKHIGDLAVIMENSTIEGTTLTVGSVSSGMIEIGQQLILHDMISANTRIVSGADLTWTINNNQSLPNNTILGLTPGPKIGNATDFSKCWGIPNQPVDLYSTILWLSDVIIDSVTQPKNQNRWIVPSGSTISGNLNVEFGRPNILPPG